MWSSDEENYDDVRHLIHTAKGMPPGEGQRKYRAEINVGRNGKRRYSSTQRKPTARSSPFLIVNDTWKTVTSSNKWLKLCTINKVQSLLQKPELYLALEKYLTSWSHTTGGFYKTSILSSLVKFASYN